MHTSLWSRWMSRLPWMILIAVISTLSCEEQLPEYQDPQEIFEESITGKYIYSASSNYMKVYLTMVNRYDETLEAKGVMEGTIDIRFLRDDKVKKTLAVSAQHLVESWKYNSSTGVLRVDPGGVLTFAVNWDFIDDNGLDLRIHKFNYSVDLDCPFRCVAAEEEFILAGEVKIFDKVLASQFGPVRFSICHLNTWIPVNYCPIVRTDVPCSKRPEVFAGRCNPWGELMQENAP